MKFQQSTRYKWVTLECSMFIYSEFTSTFITVKWISKLLLVFLFLHFCCCFRPTQIESLLLRRPSDCYLMALYLSPTNFTIFLNGSISNNIHINLSHLIGILRSPNQLKSDLFPFQWQTDTGPTFIYQRIDMKVNMGCDK